MNEKEEPVAHSQPGMERAYGKLMWSMMLHVTGRVCCVCHRAPTHPTTARRFHNNRLCSIHSDAQVTEAGLVVDGEE